MKKEIRVKAKKKISEKEEIRELYRTNIRILEYNISRLTDLNAKIK